VPIMVHDVKRGRTEVICGQGPAPAGATISYYESLGLDLIPGTGLLAPCVPGCFDAFMLLLRDYGTMRLEEVLSAAIGYARHGHPLLERASATIATVKDQFLTHWPTSAALWLDQGNVPAPGVMFRNAVLAETYERVLRESAGPGGRDAEIERARRVWSEGFVADAIDRFCRTQEVMDVSGRAHRGVLTGADMAAWSAAVEAPIGYDYGRYRVQKPGPWCQGLVTLQQLAILKHFPFDGLDPVGADFIHWQVEAAKLAFADRDTFYGDPDFVTVPVEILLSDAYSAKRQALISERASLDQRPGAIPGHGKMLETRLGSDRTAVGSGGAGEPTVGRLGESKGDTVHFDIIDRFGNMVCATPSGGWLQSSPSIPELGFCLGTRAQMFTLDEQHPACLAPGKRPRSTLSPTIALRDGEPYLAWGSPGGDQQDQWIPQFFLRHVHAGYNLQEAIDAPAWHSEHFPSSFWPRAARPGVLVVENRVPHATVVELEERGHIVEIGSDWSEGRLVAASREKDRMKAAANPRGMQGYAMGR
jgi:gamma-glutamyltranspeptidase / glutathione hydrolase